ncbi:MAG: tRNA 2-thiouridine(34) synthase MnmA [Syntrophales bacterium]|nr:tRNA 2-thiouridine(34) synthase MnmA [Syntrophales bacterium]
MTKGKVAVAMSGGVDSSVAAFLLREAGYEVVGFTMTRVGVSEKGAKVSSQEVENAKKVCSYLGMEHFVIDVTEELEEQVIGPFIDEYLRGRTPNPCVNCNRFIKFGCLIENIMAQGFDFMATGHYARLGFRGRHLTLMKGQDKIKDQSYFLHAIAREQLTRIMFPLGELTKKEVKQIAQINGIPAVHHVESQDICFIPENGYGEFLKGRGFNINPGDFVDRQGRILGKHRGSLLYTIGQRARLGGMNTGRLYVIGIDPPRNLVFLGGKEELLSRYLEADQVNLLADDLPVSCKAKIRYAHQPAACRVELNEGILNVFFDTPQEAITPGQFVVLYEGDVVLGGGRIISTGVETISHP